MKQYILEVILPATFILVMVYFLTKPKKARFGKLHQYFNDTFNFLESTSKDFDPEVNFTTNPSARVYAHNGKLGKVPLTPSRLKNFE